MKTSDSNRPRLLEAALRWDIPQLSHRFKREASRFRSTLYLLPSAFDERESSQGQDAGDAVLTAAAKVLQNQALGRPFVEDPFHSLGRLSALDLLFRDLWLAWLDESDEDRITKAAKRVARADISPDLKAHCYVKLATWSWVRGHPEQAHTYFDRAGRHAQGELKIVLDENGSFFARDTAIYFERPRFSELIRYPWIEDFSLRAAASGLSAPLRARARGSRSITLGGSGVAGERDIEAALLQAEWAGAFWLLKDLYGIKAGLLLGSPVSGSQLAEGLSLWALSGGERPGQLIDSFEARFDENTASDISNHLKTGARLRHEETWLAICGALWDEVSDDLARKLIKSVPLDAAFAEQYPQGKPAEALSLFAVLAARNRTDWMERFEGLAPVLRGLTLRLMAPTVAALLPRRVLALALRDVFDEPEVEGQWKVTGWLTIASAVKRVGAQKWQSLLSEQIPHTTVSAVAHAYPGLLPTDLIETCVTESAEGLARIRREWERGAYSMSTYDPTVNAVRIVLASGQRSDEILSALVHQSTATGPSPEQAALALWGLSQLHRAGLAELDEIKLALSPRTEGGPDFWDGRVNERLEDVHRAILATWLDESPQARLLAATKDPSPRVRRVAVEAFLDFAARDSNELTDGVIFAALYDPDDSVQRIGIHGLARGAIKSDIWTQIGWARLLDLWPEAHRSVRATLVSEVLENEVEGAEASQILSLALSDRSASVSAPAKRAQRARKVRPLK